MKTIEERAKEYCYNNTILVIVDDRGTQLEKKGSSLKAYIQGATDQQKIDIDKACDAYCKICDTKDCEETVEKIVSMLNTNWLTGDYESDIKKVTKYIIQHWND